MVATNYASRTIAESETATSGMPVRVRHGATGMICCWLNQSELRYGD